ncbi:hypothetical protein [Variovorax beijingensis]|uniref:hypothetical protein n=1 Tax=Variovorax beijingensis TaxID=2496117 RepID=UPI000F60A677|nr:hypothetical protein [Variovorax beijingensis]
MGIYRHLSVEELQATRSRLMASLHDRLASPTSAAHNGRSVQYQQNVAEIRKESNSPLEAVVDGWTV